MKISNRLFTAVKKSRISNEQLNITSTLRNGIVKYYYKDETFELPRCKGGCQFCRECISDTALKHFYDEDMDIKIKKLLVKHL